MKQRQRKKLEKKLPQVDRRGVLIYLSTDGSRRSCRVDLYFMTVDPEHGDPYMDESGCPGEFVDDWRRRDRQDGCPACVEEGMP